MCISAFSVSQVFFDLSYYYIFNYVVIGTSGPSYELGFIRLSLKVLQFSIMMLYVRLDLPASKALFDLL